MIFKMDRKLFIVFLIENTIFHKFNQSISTVFDLLMLNIMNIQTFLKNLGRRPNHRSNSEDFHRTNLIGYQEFILVLSTTTRLTLEIFSHPHYIRASSGYVILSFLTHFHSAQILLRIYIV